VLPWMRRHARAGSFLLSCANALHSLIRLLLFIQNIF
jgi:hypothetical protein